MRQKLFSKVSAYRIRRGHSLISSLLVIAAAAIAILLLMTTGCSVGPTETREDSFAVAGAPKLIVRSENGSIEINAGSENEVRVRTKLKGAGKLKYELGKQDDTITVDVRVTRPWWFFFGNTGADITITAPASTDVELETSNGHIELHGIEGNGTLRTSNGRLILDEVRGDFEGRTSNGSIQVNAMEGKAMLRTSNGPVDMQEVVGEVDVETSNGRISFSGNMTAGGSNRLVTSNGSVDVELLGTPSVSLDAATTNGTVTSELPIVATVTGEDYLVGKIGEGEADLFVRTSNGDVTIR